MTAPSVSAGRRGAARAPAAPDAAHGRPPPHCRHRGARRPHRLTHRLPNRRDSPRRRPPSRPRLPHRGRRALRVTGPGTAPQVIAAAAEAGSANSGSADHRVRSGSVFAARRGAARRPSAAPRPPADVRRQAAAGAVRRRSRRPRATSLVRAVVPSSWDGGGYPERELVPARDPRSARGSSRSATAWDAHGPATERLPNRGPPPRRRPGGSCAGAPRRSSTLRRSFLRPRSPRCSRTPSTARVVPRSAPPWPPRRRSARVPAGVLAHADRVAWAAVQPARKPGGLAGSRLR